MSLFENVITVVFQSVFHLEMYQNNIFKKKNIIFDIKASKWSKNTKKILIWSKKKYKNFLYFFKNIFETQKQIATKYIA